MAENDIQYSYTMLAAADLSAQQYKIVRQTAAETCNIASLGTDSTICGVLGNKPKSGEFAQIVDSGLCKVVAGASMTQGLHFMPSSNGNAVPVTSGGVACGRALQTGGDGELITARLYPPFRWSGAP